VEDVGGAKFSSLEECEVCKKGRGIEACFDTGKRRGFRREKKGMNGVAFKREGGRPRDQEKGTKASRVDEKKRKKGGTTFESSPGSRGKGKKKFP